MTKVIIISNSSLDGLYDQTLDYLHEKYHQYPSSLSDRSLTEAEKNKISSWNSSGNISEQSDTGKNVY